jgi:hypothetical protein
MYMIMARATMSVESRLVSFVTSGVVNAPGGPCRGHGGVSSILNLSGLTEKPFLSRLFSEIDF